MRRKNECGNQSEKPKDDPQPSPPQQHKECDGAVEERPCDTTDQPSKRKCCCSQWTA